MLLQLIRKELLEHLMSLRFAVACVLCFIVVISSLFVRGQDYAQVLDDYHEGCAIEGGALKRMEHPSRLISQGVNVHKAPNPLKLFVRGAEDDSGLAVRISGNDAPQFVMADVQIPPVLLFPAMDTVAFVGMIMSLLAIVFAYDAVSGEKERGTLRLVLSHSVPRDTVLLGKWIGGYLALVVPFVLALISGAVIALVQPDISLSGPQWTRLVSLSALALVYVAAIFSAALYVSCLTRRSSTSIMMLVTAWMVLILAIPNLSPYLAQAWLPTPDRTASRAAEETASKEIWEREVESKMQVYDKENGFTSDKSWSRQIDWRSPEGRKKGRTRQLYQMELEGKARIDQLRARERIEQDLQRGMDAQTSLGKWISRLSPFSCFVMAATEVTDTGELGRRRFVEQIRGYQEALVGYAYAEWMAMYRYELEHGEGAPSWADPGNRQAPVPGFSYAPPAAVDCVKMVAPDVCILAGVAVLFFMLSYVAFLRYDVR